MNLTHFIIVSLPQSNYSGYTDQTTIVDGQG